MILTDSIKIKAPPNKVFSFFTGIKDDESYKAWHPDHVVFRWIKGRPFPLSIFFPQNQFIMEATKSVFVIWDNYIFYCLKGDDSSLCSSTIHYTSTSNPVMRCPLLAV